MEAATFHVLASVLLSNKDENDKLLRSISIIIIQKQNITYICRFTKELSNFGLAVEPLHSGGRGGGGGGTNHKSISNATVEAATFHVLASVLLSNKDENDKLLRSISIIIIQKQNITYICRFTKELSNFGLAVEPLHSGGGGTITNQYQTPQWRLQHFTFWHRFYFPTKMRTTNCSDQFQ